MTEKPKFLLVDTQVLPDVFLKVMDAKIMIARGEAKNSSDAARLAGISRSAFYKYKDCVFMPSAEDSHTVVSFSVTLRDEPGQLSKLIAVFHRLGCNIVSINQNLPVDSVAQVSVSVRISGVDHAGDKLLQKIKQLSGVVDVKLITAE